MVKISSQISPNLYLLRKQNNCNLSIVFVLDDCNRNNSVLMAN